MKTTFAGIIAATMLVGPGVAWTQDEVAEDEAETTIRLMGAAEAELPSAVTDPIELPDAVPDDAAAREAGQDGIDNANLNRARREEGLMTADEARERGAEAVEDAMENRENQGRSEDRPEPPDNPGPPNN